MRQKTITHKTYSSSMYLNKKLIAKLEDEVATRSGQSLQK